MEERRLRLEEVSEGLHKALQDCQSAIGVGHDGTIYTAHVYGPARPAGFVLIDRKRATDRLRLPVLEPEGVVWKPKLPDQEPVKLKKVVSAHKSWA